MRQRGRKSSASLSVVTGGATIERPLPPDELTDEMKDEWVATVNRLEADWFTRETHPILVQYCRHVVTARRVAQLIQNMETVPEDSETGFDIDEYDKLLRMQEREGRAISSLATRMRLTQQAKYTTQAAGTSRGKSKTSKKPWQQK